jgi:hypothetical protein
MNNRLRQNNQDQLNEQDAAEQFEPESDPSWFLDPANEDNRENLMARYRQARNLPDPSQRPAPGAAPISWQPQDWVETHPRPPARFLQQGQKTSPVRTASRQRVERSLPATFALAALIAAIGGGAAGFINARIDPMVERVKAVATIMTATAPALQPPPELQATAQTVITKKPIAIATLDVQDVAGETNSLIPLALHAEPALEGQDLLLQISGLPDKAYLTSGHKSAQVWTLAPEDLNDLKLVMPDGSKNEIDVAVAAVERNTGELAAPVKSMTIALSGAVVQPASAPPPGTIQPEPGGSALSNQLAAIPHPGVVGIAQSAALEAAAAKASLGDDLLKSGDVTAAREAYGEAWTLGSAEGAYRLAQSYDPLILASLKLDAPQSDTATALQWYERAAIAGKTEARSAIVRLKLKP